ncbi:AAA family ATPase [Flavobacteriales bacterium]|nr:AAA family ATPase [Flavobacteriales bacterium]
MGDFQWTKEQLDCLHRTAAILGDVDPSMAVIRGHAGTGKSTLMAELNKRATEAGFITKFVAPTNSAAMNLHDRIGVPCTTIHNSIYKPVVTGDMVRFEARSGMVEDKVLWMVDEASMVSNQLTSGAFQTPSTVLVDLVEHIQKHAKVPKVVFVGDVFQLPPVGEDQSDALDPTILSQIWGGDTEVVMSKLTHVMRQAEGSPILDMTARAIGLMQSNAGYHWKSSGGMLGMPWEWKVLNAVTATAEDATEGPKLKTVSIVYSNKEVNFMNNSVRDMMDREPGKLSVGDHLVTDKSTVIEGLIIPKGTRVVVTDVDGAPHRWGGCRFQGAEFATELGSEPMRHLLNLDVLFSEKGNIGSEAEKKLKEEAMRSNPKYREYQNDADEPHMSAVRARFGYSMTAHKAQGREFDKVYIKPIWSSYNTDFQNWQWLYTALTRARQSVSTIDFRAA